MKQQLGQVLDTTIALSDTTLNNVSTSRHGFAPKLPNDEKKFLNGVGAWSAVVPYKQYVALLTQSDTAAPSATVLENTLDGTVTWSRTSAGTYRATLAGAFTASKTALFIAPPPDAGAERTISITRISANAIEVQTAESGALTDSKLSETTIEIRVYP